MADTNNTRSPERSDSTKGEQGKNDKMSQSGKDRGSNQTMQHEQAKATVSGGGQSSGQFRGQSGAREQGSQISVRRTRAVLAQA